MIVDVSKSSIILSSAPVIKLLKSKDASSVIDIKVTEMFRNQCALGGVNFNSSCHSLIMFTK